MFPAMIQRYTLAQKDQVGRPVPSLDLVSSRFAVAITISMKREVTENSVNELRLRRFQEA